MKDSIPVPVKSALIIGASGAIGSTIARHLAKDGWQLFLTYRTESQQFTEQVDQLRLLGVQTTTIQVDLSEDKAFAIVNNAIGDSPLDGVVYASGPKVRMTYISKITPEEMIIQFNEDTLAFYNMIQPLLPALRKSQGALVSITSAAVGRYAKQDILSIAPKAAIEAFTKGIASEEGRFGVRANCIGVGVIDSGLWHDLIEQGAYTDTYLSAAKRAIALQRFGTPHDVASAASFLLSDKANWISGQTLNVDGGYSL